MTGEGLPAPAAACPACGEPPVDGALGVTVGYSWSPPVQVLLRVRQPATERALGRKTTAALTPDEAVLLAGKLLAAVNMLTGSHWYVGHPDAAAKAVGGGGS